MQEQSTAMQADPQSPNPKSLKGIVGRWLSVVLPVALGIFLTVYTYDQFSERQIAELKGYFRSADYLYIVLAGLIAILGSASRAYRWKYALEQMGYASTFANNFMAVNICYLLNLAIPKSGEISRALIVKKYNGIPFDKGFGTIVAERIIDMVILLLFMGLAVFLQFDIAKAFVLDKIPLNRLVVLLVAGVFVLSFLLLVYLYSRSPIILKLKQQVAGLKEGLLSVFHMRNKWAYFGHTVFIWWSYIFMFYITIFTLPETSTLSFGAVVTAFVVGSIAVGFTNSGFGSYPFLIMQILLFYSVSKTAGTAFGWIVWTSQMIVLVLLGLGSFLFLPILNRTK